MTEDTSATLEREVTVREFSVPAEEGQLSRVRDFIAEVCEESGFSTRETSNTKLAVDEACTNIIKHAYSGSVGEIRIRTETEPGKIEISLLDSGRHFDFAGVKDPDLDHYVETGRKGGFGVYLINRLMDGVEYRAGDTGNELVLTKRSATGLGRTLTSGISWKASLRYKFTLRATAGLFVIIAALWGYIFARQTVALNSERATRWLEKRRLAESVANKSTDLLLRPERYSIEQTTLTAFLTRTAEVSDDLAYVHVVDRNGNVISSSDIDQIFNDFEAPEGRVLTEDERGVRWTQRQSDDRVVRDIELPVRIRSEDGNSYATLGTVHLGAFADRVERLDDPRPMTTLIILSLFLVGVVLIAGLVSVFVRPIQVLTDGVRAIGQGTLEGRINVEGPAEIGAIASVFNEITAKFKKAQESVLEQEKLQKEIEVAKQIQQALLPKRHPAVSGYDIAPYYQAAKEVGGDYYDFVQVDDDTLGVVVADVSGKGVPGSLVMTMIRTALRMEARGNKNASDVMSKMNDFVTDDMKKGMFVTMFYVILDSKNRIISYASAGHNPMILFRGETNETFFLNPKGFPVGISLPDDSLFRRSISLEKIKLKKDDMLLIYTDGVTEAMNEKREQYGEARLIEAVKRYGALHPTEFIERLEADIKFFTGGFAQNDDITVVAVKEKLAADEVLVGIRKKLIDMVETEGMGVKEACRQMNVSPTTYYRYKKRMDVMGEEGLRNKVSRDDVELKRVSIEQRKDLLDIVAPHPEYGAKRIVEAYNRGRDADRHLTERMVYDELKRLNLNTKERRIDYLRRHGLYDADKPTPESERTSTEIVDDLVESVTAISGSATEEKTIADEGNRPSAGETGESSVLEGPRDASPDPAAVERVTSPAGIGVMHLEGHVDSVSAALVEQKLQRLIERSINRIVVDLSDVLYISSGGWGVIVGEVRRLRQDHGDVVLVGMVPEVHDVYEMLGFNDIMRSFATIDEAKSYLELPEEERESSREDAAPDSPRSTVGIPEEVESVLIGESPGLRIEAATVGDRADIAVISLEGIIDTVSASHLRTALDKTIRSGIDRIVVDMSEVEYVSSGGWGTFTERLRELRRQGGDVKLFGMDPDVDYVFTMLGFNIVLSSFDILTEAIEDFEVDEDGGETRTGAGPGSGEVEENGVGEDEWPQRPSDPGPSPEADVQPDEDAPRLGGMESSHSTAEGDSPAPTWDPDDEWLHRTDELFSDLENDPQRVFIYGDEAAEENNDKKLRNLGWEKYGQRLSRRKRKKDGNDE